MTDHPFTFRSVPAAVAPMSPRAAVAAAAAATGAFASSGPQVPVLNRRDVVVLSGLAGGRSTAQIATSLAVSRNTARTRIRRVQSKLDVADRAAAVRAAQDLGVLMTMS
jgi:ATP/maltotriose-dependent transcriptional regulator MalT